MSRVTEPFTSFLNDKLDRIEKDQLSQTYVVGHQWMTDFIQHIQQPINWNIDGTLAKFNKVLVNPAMSTDGTFHPKTRTIQFRITYGTSPVFEHEDNSALQIELESLGFKNVMSKEMGNVFTLTACTR